MEISWETGSCAVCAAEPVDEPVFVGRDITSGKPGEMNLHRCVGCRHVYLSPRPAPDSLGFYYDQVYSGDGERFWRFVQDSKEFATKRTLGWIEEIRPLSPGDRVLDVGCSFGHFIEYFREHRGIEASAIDFDEGTIERFINPDQIDVRCGELREAGFEESSFDVVTMNHLLEHTYDPVDELSVVASLLKPGGLVVIEVPNWESIVRPLTGRFWYALILPQHLHHFSAASLRAVVAKAGLEPVKLNQVYVPVDFALSFCLMLCVLFGVTPSKLGQASLPFRLLLIVTFLPLLLFVDIPAQFVKVAFGQGSNLSLIARRPVADSPQLPPS